MSEMPQTAPMIEPEEFGLYAGVTVEVMNMANHLAFVGKVESTRGGAVTLRESKGGDLPRVTYNQELKLRFLRDGETTMVQGKVCGSTDQFWKVDRLETKFTREQRAFFRQGISTSIQAKCFRRSSRGIPEKNGTPCQVMDVSAGGLMFTSAEAYEVGQRLAVTGVRLTDSMDPFNFNCQVRRAGQLEGGVTHYGCQFEPMLGKEQDRLLRAIFIVQREEIRLQKEKGRL